MKKEKYASKKINGIIHCPKCRGVLFRDYKKDNNIGGASFKTRCPHCKKGVSIKIVDNRPMIQHKH